MKAILINLFLAFSIISTSANAQYFDWEPEPDFPGFPTNPTPPPPPTNPTPAPIPSNPLSDAERRAFLEHYAPIIFKRGNSNKGDHGRDWITNFDFDRNNIFSDNKRNWKNIGRYIDAATAGPNSYYQRWRIRPTLYTALMEYNEGAKKNLVLIYHVYHASDENAAGKNQLHDWERVEMHIKGVSDTPNRGELFAFAVLTQHKRSVIRRSGSPDLNFLSTNTGKHLLLWQAEWSGKLGGPHGQELRYVENSASQILSDMSRNKDAEVDVIANSNDKNVHYAFIPGGSASAVSTFNAKVLTYETAPQLTSYADNGNTENWSQAKRIQYELQDIADIIPTHWANGPFELHWTTENSERIKISTPFTNSAGHSISGLQTFYTKSYDPDFEDGRSGYLSKSWLFGTYDLRDACDVSFGGLLSGSTCTSKSNSFDENSFNSTHRDLNGLTRSQANGDPASARSYWLQHDYFLHNGVQDSSKQTEQGYWLPSGWQLPQRGGFDGRWVSLFADNINNDPISPLQVAINRPSSNTCREGGQHTATAYGGKLPYTFTWKLGTNVVKTDNGSNRSSHYLYANVPYSVEVRDSSGQARQFALTFTYQCGPNEFLR